MINRLSLLSVGDIILGANSDPLFQFVIPTLQRADVVLGQLEVPFTTRDRHAVEHGRIPGNLKPLVNAGFDVLTFASNHILDAGEEGIEDTLQWLRENRIPYTGGGMDITESRRPVIVEREGTRFGFLNYNCVGPKETWATSEKPGCAYVHVITHYELDHATPGGPPNIYTWAETKTLRAMAEDIQSLRPLCDVLAVSFHKGIAHTPARLAEYEHQVSYAAIDAGADVIFGHHAHILKGIEKYNGKVIFHGLCNFVSYLPLLAPKPNQDPLSWARRRRELFGFDPDPEYPTYPFHPDAKYTIIAKCTVEDKHLAQVSFLPCLVDMQAAPHVLERDAQGQAVFDYMDKITRAAELNAQFEWQGDEILVR